MKVAGKIAVWRSQIGDKMFVYLHGNKDILLIKFLRPSFILFMFPFLVVNLELFFALALVNVFSRSIFLAVQRIPSFMLQLDEN